MMTTTGRTGSKPLLAPILYGGLAAGVLDIVAAGTQTLMRGGQLERLFQTIASGWLGSGAYDGGVASATLGFFSHFMVATSWSAVFVLAVHQLPALLERPWVVGPLYGVFVWSMMRWVVLPLSAYPLKAGSNPRNIAIGLAIHVTCVGLPIVLAVRAAMSRRRE